MKATGVGDYVTYGVTIAEAGIYDVRVKTNTGSNTGIFQLSIDGVNQGYPQKQGTDGSRDGYSVRDLGSVKFANRRAEGFSVFGYRAESGWNEV